MEQVFFGFNESDIQQRLLDLRPIVSDGVAREFMISEDYSLVERPHVTEACVLRNDVTVVKSLDLHRHARMRPADHARQNLCRIVPSLRTATVPSPPHVVTAPML